MSRCPLDMWLFSQFAVAAPRFPSMNLLIGKLFWSEKPSPVPQIQQRGTQTMVITENIVARLQSMSKQAFTPYPRRRNGSWFDSQSLLGALRLRLFNMACFMPFKKALFLLIFSSVTRECNCLGRICSKVARSLRGQLSWISMRHLLICYLLRISLGG